MDSSLGGSIIALILQQIEVYQNSMFGALSSSFKPFSRAILTIYIIVVGYRVLMGKAGENAKNWAISIVILMVIQSLLFEPGQYQHWISEPIKGITYDLAEFFAGGKDLFTRLDAAAGKLIAAVSLIEPGGSFVLNTMAYIKITIACVLLLLFIGALYMVYLVQAALALFALNILLMIGVPFLFFACFDETRFITWTWLKTTLQYALWLIMLSMVMGICMPGIELVGDQLASWDAVRDGVFTRQLGITFLVTALVTYFLLKTSDLSAALTGGMGMQSNLAAGGLAAAGGALGGGLNMLGSKAAPYAQGLGKQAAGLASRTASTAASGAVRAYSAMKGITK